MSFLDFIYDRLIDIKHERPLILHFITAKDFSDEAIDNLERQIEADATKCYKLGFFDAIKELGNYE